MFYKNPTNILLFNLYSLLNIVLRLGKIYKVVKLDNHLYDLFTFIFLTKYF